jgi:hypothetical protein
MGGSMRDVERQVQVEWEGARRFGAPDGGLSYRGALSVVYAGRALDYRGRTPQHGALCRAEVWTVTEVETGAKYAAAVGPGVLGCSCGLVCASGLGPGATVPCRHVLAAVRSKQLAVAAYTGSALWG